jgi:hypothetical protein
MNLNLSRPGIAAWLCALFAVVVGAKLWLIQAYGTAIPYWDQWDEAGLLFKPWLEGHLTWSAMFAPHNEHRIFFTRALDLFVVWLNGQWDPMLQMTINAFIHAGYACGLAYCVWVFTGRKNEGLICFLMAPFFAFPFAAENTIHGFQSQMYFLDIFSVVTIVGLGFGRPGSRWWFLGIAAGIMSIFTMGSGLLASLAVAGLVVLRMLKRRNVNGDHLITLGCSLAIFIFGLSLNVTVEADRQFQAKTLWMFLYALMENLAWPFYHHRAMSCVVCLPLAMTVVKYFRSGFKDPRAAEFILCLGFWGFLQSAALAYGRAVLENSSRYMDTLDNIPIASLASLFILAENMEFRQLSRQLALFFAGFWVAALFWGMGQISWPTGGDPTMPASYFGWSRMWGLVQEENVRAFVATNDPAILSNKPLLAIPYVNPAWLIEQLRDPKLSAIMPPACRAPLKLEKDEKSGASFVLDGCPPEKPKQEFTRVWGNYPTNASNAPGSFVSKPLSAALPKLIVPVCCGDSLQDIQIQLVEEKTGRTIELRPEVAGRWHTLIVTAPQNPFRLEITDQNHNSWVAVGEIKELGRLSYCALFPLNHAAAILLAGFCLFACVAGFELLRRKIIFQDGSPAEMIIVLASVGAIACIWPARNFDAAQVSAGLQKNWALNFASAGDMPGAEMHLREALWLQPDDPETLDTLANAVLLDPGLEKNTAREQAVLYYEAALRLKPDYSEARRHLHRTLLELGRQDDAVN